MRQFLRSVAITLALSVIVVSSRAEDPPKSPEEEAAHNELITFRKELTTAYNAGDIDKVAAFLDDNVIVTWQNAHVNKGPKEFKAYCEKMLRGPDHMVESSTIDPKPELSVLYNDNKTAVAYGSSRDHYKLTDGKDFEQDTRWSSTLVKKNGKWKVVSVHISTNMFDNPVLHIAMQRTAWWTGGVAGVVALLLGALVGVVVTRRRKA
jgi:ketosteroid isomerase-like protein